MRRVQAAAERQGTAHLGIACQAHDALLNPGAAAVVEAHNRRPRLRMAWHGGCVQ